MGKPLIREVLPEMPEGALEQVIRLKYGAEVDTDPFVS